MFASFPGAIAALPTTPERPCQKLVVHVKDTRCGSNPWMTRGVLNERPLHSSIRAAGARFRVSTPQPA